MWPVMIELKWRTLKPCHPVDWFLWKAASFHPASCFAAHSRSAKTNKGRLANHHAATPEKTGITTAKAKNTVSTMTALFSVRSPPPKSGAKQSGVRVNESGAS